MFFVTFKSVLYLTSEIGTFRLFMAESDTSTPIAAGDEGFDNLPLDDENTTDED